MSPLSVDQDKCKRDALCVAVCPMGIIEMKDAESLPTWVEGARDLCIDCGHCVCVCPAEALTVENMSPELCDTFRKDTLPSYGQVDHFLRSRRSVRNFAKKPVDRDVLRALIETASYAPSGHNLQPVHWLVIRDREEVQGMAGLVVDWMRETVEKEPEIAQSLHMDRSIAAWERGQDRVLRNAPHLIVAHADKSMRVSAAACIIALTYVELAATSRGLGACWAGYFNAAAGSYAPLLDTLALPDNHQTFGAMMVGHRTYHYPRIPVRREPRITWR